MKNFPLPYNEELVYSVIARARVHFLISSPKWLIEQALASRTSIATLDLPSHLGKLSQQFQFRAVTIETLVFNIPCSPYTRHLSHKKERLGASSG